MSTRSPLKTKSRRRSPTPPMKRRRHGPLGQLAVHIVAASAVARLCNRFEIVEWRGDLVAPKTCAQQLTLPWVLLEDDSNRELCCSASTVCSVLHNAEEVLSWKSSLARLQRHSDPAARDPRAARDLRCGTVVPFAVGPSYRRQALTSGYSRPRYQTRAMPCGSSTAGPGARASNAAGGRTLRPSMSFKGAPPRSALRDECMHAHRRSTLWRG